MLRERLECLAPHVRGRRVLDVGCVDARPARGASQERAARPTSLFLRLGELAGELVGVDLDAAGVEHLRALGYRVEQADAGSMDLGRRFDTIVAGEVIEHVEDPGRLLRNLRAHLEPEGVLALSTPNPFAARQAGRIWRRGRPLVHEDHVGWQDPATLDTLLRRTGYEPFDGCWLQPRGSFAKTWKRLLRPYFSNAFLVLARPRPSHAPPPAQAQDTTRATAR